MLRKSIVVLVLFALLSCSLHSCSGNDTLRPEGLEEKIFADFVDAGIEFPHPGRIHNEVILSFHRKHSLITAGPCRKPEFVRLVTGSFNEVLAEHGIDVKVKSRDIRILVDRFVELRDRGVFDFFKRHETFPLETFDVLADEGLLPRRAARAYKDLFSAARGDGVPQRRIAPLELGAQTDDPLRDEFFVEMLTSSQSVWNEIRLEAIESIGSEEEILLQKIASIAQQYGPDSAAALFFLAALPLTYAGGVAGIALSILGSVMYNCIADGNFYDWGDMSTFPIIP